MFLILGQEEIAIKFWFHYYFQSKRDLNHYLYRVSRQNCPLFKPKLHHLKWVKFQNQGEFWKAQRKTKRSRGVPISGYYWFFSINWKNKNVVKTDFFTMDWETHPHKAFYVDGSPNLSFILKVTLGTLSKEMVLPVLIKLWKVLICTFRGVLNFNFI